MPKKNKTEIPATIQRSDQHAQDIWKEAHDHAIETYGEGASAHRVAYAALKHSYEKRGDHWVKKDKKGPSDPQAARGPTTKPKSTDVPTAPTAGGKVAKGRRDAERKRKEAAKEYQRKRRQQQKKKQKKEAA